MDNFINGIGFAGDLQQTGLVGDGYPTVNSGYAYIGNVEYYIFASGVMVELTDENTPSLPYIAGTPYFIVNALSDVKTENGIVYLETTAAVTPPNPVDCGWTCNGTTFTFTQKNLTGKYLVFDSAESVTIAKRLVEPSYLVLSNVAAGNPYDMAIDPILFASATEGIPLRFLAKVEDNNGVLLANRMIEWYKVYEPSASGVATETIVASSATDDNGVAAIDVYTNADEWDLCIYAKCDTLRSNLYWVQFVTTMQGIVANIFQFDNPAVVLASQCAMTACGIDCWGILWEEGTATEGYDAVVTGQPTDGLATRGDWKTEYAAWQRPPLRIADHAAVVYAANETAGNWNGEDFSGIYDVGPSGVWNFMKDQRVAVQGYWGQAIVSGADIRSIADLNTHCLNKTDTKYTVYHLNGDGDIVVQELADDQFGIKGSWNTVHDEATTKYDELYYVLYSPDFIGDNPVHFQSYDFYFRGLAVMNTNDQSVDYLQQNYHISDLVMLTGLQGY